MSVKSIMLAIVGILLLYLLFTVGAPFLLAILIAIFLEPLIQLAVKIKGVNRLLASSVICSLFLLLLFGISYGLGAKVYVETIQFSKKAPRIMDDANLLLKDAMNHIYAMLDTLSPGLTEQIETALGSLLSSLSSILSELSGYLFAVAKSIPTLFVSFLVFLISLYLISLQLPSIRQSFLALFEESSRQKMASVLENLRKAIFGFFIAQLILSLITYVIVLTGLLIMRVEYALAISFLIVVVDILPILGTGSVLVPWSLYSLLVGDYFLAVGLLILFLVITVVRRIMEPKVLGNAVGIGALSALISLFVGFKLVGVVGLFLGPAVVIIYKAMRQVGLLQIKIKLE
ncbi:sporulation integral membrane protein YtvI [Paenibacillus sp. J2TS4]|uniref:sporulation integral membrane protein YtvI n=1 Tax=Paenibacillus sp. J2TS4 TaxID=2807194 RepID=UPI001B05E915|nr:sporulation integral membrane protein YtvI [Paenibacillus sp. J2TS4]GIP33680.1 sporulation integral membrane protein YtvI [Paenibacillus sp. J2TS4]